MGLVELRCRGKCWQAEQDDVILECQALVELRYKTMVG